MRDLDSRWNFNKVRFYSDEDEGDDVSFRALKVKNLKLDAMADYLYRTLSPAEKVECAKFINGGRIPPFGNLTDAHHSTCYRIWRMRSFAKGR